MSYWFGRRFDMGLCTRAYRGLIHGPPVAS